MDAYLKDKREVCKYGKGCYQKNESHLKRFKHPPNSKDKPSGVKGDIRSFFTPKQNGEKENNVGNGKRANENGDESQAKKVKHDLSSDEEESIENDTKSAHDSSSDKVETKDKEQPTSDSHEETYDDILPPSPKNIRDSIKQKFLVEMPEDFYDFFTFCKSLNSYDPSNALASAELKLVGPFDILTKSIPEDKPRSQSLYLRHWRFYYDPPEFQTIITATGENIGQFHMGYFRDNPTDLPVFVAANLAAEGPKLSPLGGNVFAAVYNHISGKIKTADPFSKTRLSALQDKIKNFVKEKDFSLEMRTAVMRQRDKLKLAPTFHGAGMVVPYDKKSQVGYREIPETTPALKRIFKNVVEAEGDDERDKAFDVLQELVTNVQFANDEGDPGMGLELGIDGFCYGGEILHNTVLHLMGVAYDLLDRDQFGVILKTHLANRSKDTDLNMFKK